MKKTTVKTKRGMNALVWKEEDLFVAQGVEVDVASQGKTKAEALTNLEEAIELYFENEQVGHKLKPRKGVTIHSITPDISYA